MSAEVGLRKARKWYCGPISLRAVRNRPCITRCLMRKVRPSPWLVFRLYKYMAKSVKVVPKKRGRPATGKDPLMGFRAAPVMRATVIKWAENQPDHPTLSEAIRRLVEIGLSKSEPPKRPKVLSTAKQSVARARELATATLDKQSDPAASDEERKVIKRKLVEGPSVFRDARKDRPGK